MKSVYQYTGRLFLKQSNVKFLHLVLGMFIRARHTKFRLGKSICFHLVVFVSMLQRTPCQLLL